jgi:outer membrane lipoprotein-sorting protein
MKMRIMGVTMVACAAVLMVSGCGQSETTETAPTVEEAVATVAGGIVEVDSTVFSSVGYDAEAQALTLVFRENGRTYVYSGIPAEMGEAFINADSLGTYYHENIRGKFESAEQ